MVIIACKANCFVQSWRKIKGFDCWENNIGMWFSWDPVPFYFDFYHISHHSDGKWNLVFICFFFFLLSSAFLFGNNAGCDGWLYRFGTSTSALSAFILFCLHDTHLEITTVNVTAFAIKHFYRMEENDVLLKFFIILKIVRQDPLEMVSKTLKKWCPMQSDVVKIFK